MQTQEALQQQRPDWVTSSLKMMDEAPSVELAKVTDASGKVLFSSQGDPAELRLTSEELAEIPMISGDQPHVFRFGGQRWEGVKAIYSGPTLMRICVGRSRSNVGLRTTGHGASKYRLRLA